MICDAMLKAIYFSKQLSIGGRNVRNSIFCFKEHVFLGPRIKYILWGQDKIYPVGSGRNRMLMSRRMNGKISTF